MEMLRNRQCVSFAGTKLILEGDLLEVALATKKVMDAGFSESVLIFDDESQIVEIDFRGSLDAVNERIRQAQSANETAKATAETNSSVLEKAKPGRPKLGVIAREVTLLPRHWDWLNAQPGGASVTLRKLIESARNGNSDIDRIKKKQEIAYRFISAMAGNEIGFESATRALFRNDPQNFELATETWPVDVKTHARKLATDLLRDR